MTAAERLVRNLCEAKRAQIEQARREGLKKAQKINDKVPPSKLPMGIRQALKDYDHAQRMVAHAKKMLDAHGFTIPYGYVPGGSVSYTRSVRQGAEAKVTAEAETRIAKLMKCRTDATIDTIGKSPAQVRERLEKLRRDVAKV